MDKGDGGYENPRNAASGISRRKTVKKNLLKNLKMLAFDCDTDDIVFKKEHHKIRYMEALGIDCVFTKVVDIDNAIKGHRVYQDTKRAKLGHEIDGIVLKVNDIANQKALGETGGRPKGQVAWKFEAEMRETVLEDVEWEVGLTGRITPVAVLKPVKVGGVTIERASLHNVSNIARLGLWIGAEVLVSRRNDVIPYIEKTIKPSTKHYPPYPKGCPVCHADTEFEGEYLICPNKDCPAKKAGDIKKWVKVLGIDEVGDAFITAAIQAGFLEDPADLYTLSADTISTLDGYQQKSAKKIVTNINKKRRIPLAKFFAALNIPGVGLSTFEAIEAFDTITKLDEMLATCTSPLVSELAAIPGIGEKTAKQVRAGVVAKMPLIIKLLKSGVEIKEKIIGKLTGKSFCFTGQLSIRRPDAQKLVESMGGEIKTSVSRGLTYLVQSNPKSMSTKAQKARKYGTQVIGEKEFKDLVEFSFKKLKDLSTK
jgi:DNA ligase (NAD+)